ncbi:hypothetical protein ABZ831_24305, partial [Streptomyces sp. NPDC047123]
MVTFAQAQERAEEWINGEVPGYQHREVRVREFDLGFVVWAEDRENGPVSDGGAQRLVIARDSGEATLWPGLPVGEVIRRYEEEYGLPDVGPQDAAPPPPERVDLNQTSFLLSPPEWLQEAADKLGIPDRRAGAGARADEDAERADEAAEPQDLAPSPSPSSSPSPAPAPAPAPAPFSSPSPAAASASASPDGLAETGSSGPAAPGGGTPWPAAADGGGEPERADSLPATSPGLPAGATPWAGTDTNADEGDDHSVPLPATVFAPPLANLDEDDAPPPSAAPEAKTALMHGGSQLPRTSVAPALDDASPGGPAAPPSDASQPSAGSPPPPSGASAYGYPQGPAAPAGPPSNASQPPAGSPPPPPGASAYGYPQGPDASGAAGDLASAATSKADGPRGSGAGTPPPPAPPGAPAAPAGSTPPPSGPGAPGT